MRARNKEEPGDVHVTGLFRFGMSAALMVAAFIPGYPA